jgi:hypothetical protein
MAIYTIKQVVMYFKKELPKELITRELKSRMKANVGVPFSHMGYLGQYENAINILFNHIAFHKHNLDVVALPLFYLMRHSLELGLKANLAWLEKYSRRQPARKIMHSHSIIVLLQEFKEQFYALNAKYEFEVALLNKFEELYASADKLVSELGEDASSFRYVNDIKGNSLFPTNTTIDGIKMKQNFDDAIILLSYTVDEVAIYTDYEDLVALAPQFTEGVGQVYLRVPDFQQKVLASHLSGKYEPIGDLSWRNEEKGEVLRLLAVNNECFLVPVKTI